MNTTYFVHGFLGLPILGFLISLFLSSKKEGALSVLSYSTAFLQLLFVVVFTGFWLLHGAEPVQFKEISVYRSENYDFFIDFLVVFE